MLLSMTVYGEARLQDDRWSVSVEVRSVNNRHLKITTKLSEPYTALEPEFERLIRETVRRGTINLQIRVERPRKADDYRLNTVALASYRKQLSSIQEPPGGPIDMAALLSLPGVVEDRKPSADDPQSDWPALSSVVQEALRKFQASRAEEGRAMGDELLAMGKSIADHLSAIADRGPEVVASYHKRLTERVQTLVPRDLSR